MLLEQIIFLRDKNKKIKNKVNNNESNDNNLSRNSQQNIINHQTEHD